MGWYGYSPYVSVGERKNKAAKKLLQLKKKDPNVTPVVIEGNKVATKWWGIAWCKNLESYADYANRIQRGRAYVKNGFVLDLRIEEGVVNAKVSGSSLYNVTVKINKLSKTRKDDVVKQIGRRISSIEELVSGDFPKELGEIFLMQPESEPAVSGGLFPTPEEIKFDCDCPDWAYMCKHVAAVLYGIGARLDNDPRLFFLLRGMDVNEFIKKSVDEKMKSMLKNAGKKTDRVIEDADVKGLFGI